MKIALIVIGFLLIGGFAISQVYASKATSETEMHQYEVVKKIGDIEIRKYKSATFTYVKMNAKTYKESSGMGFRTLAGYIFGGNETQEKIAMTSPVTMNLEDSVTMMFMVPSEYDMEDLPAPNDPNVKFKTEPEKIVAAIRFGGWASDSKIESYKKELVKTLDEAGIKHNGNFSFLGYNPPFELVNRRNEVVVELSRINF